MARPNNNQISSYTSKGVWLLGCGKRGVKIVGCGKRGTKNSGMWDINKIVGCGIFTLFGISCINEQ